MVAVRSSWLVGVFAPLVRALVFKTSGGFEQSSQWVRFPYTPVPSSGLPRMAVYLILWVLLTITPPVPGLTSPRDPARHLPPRTGRSPVWGDGGLPFKMPALTPEGE